jgi:mannonate dehydratase
MSKHKLPGVGDRQDGAKGGDRLERRELLRSVMAGGGLLALTSPREAAAQQQVAKATRGMPSPKIRDIKVITCAPAGVRLIVVKIITDQPGLYGYGCATFTQRADLVVPAVERYLKPFLIGKPADRIDDTWQACYNSSYWRNGPVLNNALSGVDQALWDIKGRQCGVPVYQLLGGKMREAADCYGHAGGADIPQVIETAKAFMARGFRHIRVQIGVPGMAGYGAGGSAARVPALHNAPVYEPAVYIRRALKMFEACRKELGDEVEILHDVHERITPTQAVQFCKDVEKFKLFFLEDPLSPEDIAWYRIIRQQCATPIAMGELFNSPHEWTPLIVERLIDYIRIHVSQAGGVTPCRKVAILGEMFGVRTAWHGPGDVSPIGHCANITLDLVSYNFGVQESMTFNPATQEIFSGCPVIKDGYFYANEAPGWGIEVNEKAALKYPMGKESGERGQLNGGWGEIRKRDGTLIKQ